MVTIWRHREETLTRRGCKQVTFSDFFDYFGDLDWLALLVAGVAVYVLAWLWYGPIAGRAWADSRGREYGSEMPDAPVLVQGYIQFFLYGIGLAYFMPAVHVTFGNPSSFETLLVTSFALSFFVIGMVLAGRVIWEGLSWAGWLIDVVFWFLASALSSWIVLDLMA